MGMNESKGNMYDFVTHTWNSIKGKCPHDCSYCYMKRWGALKDTRLDEKELKTDLGSGNFIFVGSSCDMFAQGIPASWVERTLGHCNEFSSNRYLFQSKNPKGIIEKGLGFIPENSILCTTIESNRFYPEVMGRSPNPEERAYFMSKLVIFDRYVTIEPVMDFDLGPMVELIKRCSPVQVNIGADSGRNGIPEPSAEKVLALIEQLKKFTTIANKRNLSRIIGGQP